MEHSNTVEGTGDDTHDGQRQASIDSQPRPAFGMSHFTPAFVLLHSRVSEASELRASSFTEPTCIGIVP